MMKQVASVLAEFVAISIVCLFAIVLYNGWGIFDWHWHAFICSAGASAVFTLYRYLSPRFPEFGIK